MRGVVKALALFAMVLVLGALHYIGMTDALLPAGISFKKFIAPALYEPNGVGERAGQIMVFLFHIGVVGTILGWMYSDQGNTAKESLALLAATAIVLAQLHYTVGLDWGFSIIAALGILVWRMRKTHKEVATGLLLFILLWNLVFLGWTILKQSTWYQRLEFPPLPSVDDINIAKMGLDWLALHPEWEMGLIIGMLILAFVFEDDKPDKKKQLVAILLLTLLLVWKLPVSGELWLMCLMVALAIVTYKSMGKGFKDTAGLMVAIVIAVMAISTITRVAPWFFPRAYLWLVPPEEKSAPAEVSRAPATPSLIPSVRDGTCIMKYVVTEGPEKGKVFRLEYRFRKEGNCITITKGTPRDPYYVEYTTTSYKNGVYSGRWVLLKKRGTPRQEGDWCVRQISARTYVGTEGADCDDGNQRADIDITVQ